MIKIALLAILFLIKLNSLCQLVSAGKPPSKPPSKAVVARQEKRETQNKLCVYKKRFSFLQIANLFPFNKAKKIQLVSYEDNWNKSPFRNKKIDSSPFKEAIVIHKGQIDSLTDILYNYTWKGTFSSIMEAHCYMPRNAILFFDSTAKPFAYIEICFGCQKYTVSNEKIKLGDFCDGKYEMLKSFFRKSGILYGTGNETED